MMLFTFLVVTLLVGTVSGHGRLALPPGRSSAWAFGFPTPINYNDWQLNCGGYDHKVQMGGQCGVCGDPIDGPRDNEGPNGKYFSGVTTGTYKAGSVIDIRIEMQANHLGWFFFKICPVTNNAVEVTQECLDRYPLEIIEAPTPRTSAYRWDIPNYESRPYSFKVKLPNGLTCDRCVLQWDWTCANRWGTSDDGRQGMGLGIQETFRGCADIRIEN